MKFKLKEIATVVGGATPSTEHEEYYNGDIIWITPKDLSNNNGNKFIEKGERNITKAGFDASNTKLIPPYNILISTRAPIGYIAINKKECCTNQGFKSLICDKTKVNVDYLYYALQMQVETLEKLGTGTTFKEVSKDAIEKFEIELPELTIQNKIASILSLVDNQIQRNNDMVQKLQVLGNTIYSKNALMQTEFFNIQDESELIWGTCPPDGHILDAENPKTQKYASGAGDILDGCSLVYPKGYTDKPIRIAKEKDVCISIAGTIGKIGICTETIAIGRAMLGVRSKNLYGYIYFGLQTFGKTLNKKSTGAIQKIINKDHIKIINFPKYNEDIRIQLNNIFDEIVLIENDTIKLQNLKSKLLPLLINGQINI